MVPPSLLTFASCQCKDINAVKVGKMSQVIRYCDEFVLKSLPSLGF